MALPEPTHTEIAENTLLVPAEQETAANRLVRSSRTVLAKPAEKPAKAKNNTKAELTPSKDNATKAKPAKSTSPKPDKNKKKPAS
nr:hypothetical protein [Tanacetum cinerariifolium]